MKGAGFIRRIECPSCASSGARSLYRCGFVEEPLWPFLVDYYPAIRDHRELFTNADYQLDACLGCGLVFQRQIGNPALMELLYDGWLNASYDPNRDEAFQLSLQRPQQSRDGHEILSFCADKRRKPSDLSVLDFGMGWGLWARIAMRLGCKVFGFDLSAERRDAARQMGIEIVTFDDIEKLSLDFINAEQVFEHLPDPSADLTRLATGLRPGGVIKIAVPNGTDIESRLSPPNFSAARDSRTSLNAVHPLEHINCFSRRCLAMMAHHHGLMTKQPSPAAALAFLATPTAVPRTPRLLAKSLARPLYNRWSRSNLYSWFEKSA